MLVQSLSSTVRSFSSLRNLRFLILLGPLILASLKSDVAVASGAAPWAYSMDIYSQQDLLKPFALAGVDPEFDNLSFTILSQPQHGTLAVSGSLPNLLYIPTPGFEGLDSFNFKVNDGTSDSGIGILTIHIEPWSPPIGIPYPEFGIDEVAPTYSQANSLHYYVDNRIVNNQSVCNDASNSSRGTPTIPRCTLPSGSNLAPGTLIEVRGGPYSGSDYMLSSNGTNNAPIFLRGAPTDRPIIEREIDVTGSFIIIENIDFNKNNLGSKFINMTDHAINIHHIAIRGNQFHHHDFDGGNTGLLSMRNRDGSAGYFVRDIVVYNNLFHDNGNYATTSQQDINAVMIGANTARAWIVDNHSYRNAGDSVMVKFGNVAVSPGLREIPTDIYIGRNFFWENGENGVDLKGSRKIIVSQNHIFNMHGYAGGTPITIHYDEGTPREHAENIWVLHNKIFNSTSYGISSSGGDARFVYVIGNLVHHMGRRGIHESSQGLMYAYNNTVDSANLSNYPTGGGIRVDSNVSGETRIVNNIVTNTSPAFTIPSGATNHHNLSTNTAIYADAGNHNFRLSLTATAAINQGYSPTMTDYAQLFNDSFAATFAQLDSTASLNLNFDIDRISRHQGSAWDIGAYEFIENGSSSSSSNSTSSYSSSTTSSNSSSSTSSSSSSANSSSTSVSSSSSPSAPPFAFEGFGAVTRGALDCLGYETFHVTSLANSGTGTLRDAVSRGCRYIVFDIGGTITLSSALQIEKSFITIDGLSAPSPGITIRQPGTNTKTVIISDTDNHVHDIIIHHLRNIGDGGHSDSSNDIWGLDGDDGEVYNIILDHITGIASNDGVFDIYGNVHDVTISWNLITHTETALHLSQEGDVRARISLHHNVFAFNNERQIRMRHHNEMIDFVNNVIYGWGWISGGGAGLDIDTNDGVPNNEFPKLNVENNMYFAANGSATRAIERTIPGMIYFNGNSFPTGETQHNSTSGRWPIPAQFEVTKYATSTLGNTVVPCVGTQLATDEERNWLLEVGTDIGGSGGACMNSSSTSSSTSSGSSTSSSSSSMSSSSSSSSTPGSSSSSSSTSTVSSASSSSAFSSSVGVDVTDIDPLYEELRPSACAGANGFLGQINFASVINLQPAPLGVVVEYRDAQGSVRGTQIETIDGNLKRDFDVRALGLEPDSYGSVCVTTSAQADGAWMGEVVRYKPARKVTAYDFALYEPFSNPRSGEYSVPLNTYHLGTDPRATVANWISISDPIAGDGEDLRGQLLFYGDTGILLFMQEVNIPDGGRTDYAGHTPLAGVENRDAVGLARFVPALMSDGGPAQYMISSARYFYDLPDSDAEFLTAFALPHRPATTRELFAGVPTKNGELSIIELNNTSNNAVSAAIAVFDELGRSAGGESLIVQAQATRHVIVNRVGSSGYLTDNAIGSARVVATGGALSSLSFFYKLGSNGKLLYGYAAPFAGSPGAAQISEYNSFIGHRSEAEIVNTTSVELAATLDILSYDGSHAFGTSLLLSPHGVGRIELDVPLDTYGTIILQGDGAVLRNYVGRVDEYVLPFPGK